MRLSKNWFALGILLALCALSPSQFFNEGTQIQSLAWVSTCKPTFQAAGDVGAIWRAAMTYAAPAGTTVDARCNAGDVGIATSPIPPTYSGTWLLPQGRLFVQSNAANFMIPARMTIMGNGVGRAQGGPAVGTAIVLCNEANPTAIHSPACAGHTYDPFAGSLTKDGNGTPFATPVICWSRDSEHCLPKNKTFDSQVWFVNVDCNYVAYCVGVQNGMTFDDPSCLGKCGAQENSGFFWGSVSNWGNHGTAIRWWLGSQNAHLSHLNLLNEGADIPDCSDALAIDSYVPSAQTGNGEKDIEDVTSTNNACVIKPNYGMWLDSSQKFVSGAHFERVVLASIRVGCRADVKGFHLDRINGVQSAGAVVQLCAGNFISGVIENVLNINNNGYTIDDLYHGLKIPVTCESMTASYSFGLSASPTVDSPSPCIPKVQVQSIWTTSQIGGLAAGDLVKEVAGSSNRVIRCTPTDNDGCFGFAMATVTDNTYPVPVGTGGIVGAYTGDIGPISDTDCPAARMYVIRSATTDGHVQCVALRPSNVEIQGKNETLIVAGQRVVMRIQHEAPTQPRGDACLGVGSNATNSVVNCGAKVWGYFWCHQTSSTHTCEIDTTVVKADSIIHVQTDNTIAGLLPGGRVCDTVYTANSLFPSIVARSVGASFTIPVPQLTTNGLCGTFTVENPTP